MHRVLRTASCLSVLIGLGVALSPGLPALAATPEELDTLITDFFVQTNDAWYGTPPAPFMAGRLNGGSVSPAAQRMALVTAGIARDARKDIGLQAELVTTLVDNVETSASTNRYEFDSAVTTSLAWNIAELGDSVLGDDYRVVVTRSGTTSWTVSGVTAVEPPPEAENPEPAPEEPEPPSCKPGEVCDPETLGTGKPLDLSKGRAKARQAQLTSRGKEPIGRETTGHGTNANRFDPNAAARYAHYWSGKDGSKDRYNRNQYGDPQPNNCTNFVSQALHAGGWKIKGGWDPNDLNNWHYDLTGPARWSKTWSVSGVLRSFGTRYTDRAVEMEVKDVADAWVMWSMLPGDMYFMDWDPNGWPDGTIDHALMVTGVFRAPSSPDFVEPSISQNSRHRQNFPLYLWIKMVFANKPDGSPSDTHRAVIYSVRTKTSFNS
jgi:Putative amidase domain